jgi:CBS domain-containing protein
MKVQEIMSTKVESIAPTASLRQAARKMSNLGIGSLPVIEDGRLLGIITDRDISCHAVALGRDPNSTEIQKIMSKDVTTCRDDQNISDAATLMADHHIRRLAVVDESARVTGMLSVDDLAHVAPDLAGAVLEAATPIH